MKAMQETTKWGDGTPCHLYLLDGDKMHAYINAVGSTVKPMYFAKPIEIDLRKRTFKEVLPNPFVVAAITSAHLRRVKGSKGEEYTVDMIAETCTCPSFRYRVRCKHL
jgi:hypothetical protein